MHIYTTHMKYAHVKDMIINEGSKKILPFFTMVGDLGNVEGVVVRACAEVLPPLVLGVGTGASSLSTAFA